jgi:dihydropteroate synthase
MLNVRGKLISIAEPQIMGVLNVTPDSFYADSRVKDEEILYLRAAQMLNEGATWLDLGACSTRPGSTPVEAEMESSRVRFALSTLRREFGDDVLISLDTFRADIARMGVEEYGVAMVNDVTAGQGDSQMFHMVSRLHVPYVLTHNSPQPIQGDAVPQVLLSLSEDLKALHELGVADVVIDPGFGFGKTLEQNYLLMARLNDFHELGCPVMVGISRKSMICRLLDVVPADALVGTIVLNTYSLLHGANFLRVHDVSEAVQALKIVTAIKESITHKPE